MASVQASRGSSEQHYRPQPTPPDAHIALGGLSSHLSSSMYDEQEQVEAFDQSAAEATHFQNGPAQAAASGAVPLHAAFKAQKVDSAPLTDAERLKLDKE